MVLWNVVGFCGDRDDVLMTRPNEGTSINIPSFDRSAQDMHASDASIILWTTSERGMPRERKMPA